MQDLEMEKRAERVLYVLIPPPLNSIPNQLSVSAIVAGLGGESVSGFAIDSCSFWGETHSTEHLAFIAQPDGVVQIYGEYSDDHCCIFDDVGHTFRLFLSAWHCS